MRLYEAVMNNVNVRNCLSRVEPTVLYLAGGAGILKTTVAESIAKKVAEKLWPDELKGNCFKYDRNPLQKHWDRYCYQPICKMEEAFCAPKQGKDTTNEEHQAWLSLISTSVYPLPMASLNDKKTVFTSELVICTSNIAYPETNSVNRDALLRRFHHHALFCWKDGYPNYVTGDTNTGAMADLSHLQIYMHDSARPVQVPSGAAQAQFGGRNYPHTVREYRDWNLRTEDGDYPMRET